MKWVWPRIRFPPSGTSRGTSLSSIRPRIAARRSEDDGVDVKKWPAPRKPVTASRNSVNCRSSFNLDGIFRIYRPGLWDPADYTESGRRVAFLNTIFRTLCAASLLAGTAFAGPPLTTIQDIIYKADGTRFNGMLTISWNGFEASDTSAIGTQMLTVKVVDGNLRVKLVPNTTTN